MLPMKYLYSINFNEPLSSIDWVFDKLLTCGKNFSLECHRKLSKNKDLEEKTSKVDRPDLTH